MGDGHLPQHVCTAGRSHPTLCRAQGAGNTILSLQAQHCTTLSGPGSDLSPDQEPTQAASTGPGTDKSSYSTQVNEQVNERMAE